MSEQAETGDMWEFIDDVRDVAKDHSLPAHIEIAAYRLLQMEMEDAIRDARDGETQTTAETDNDMGYIG